MKKSSSTFVVLFAISSITHAQTIWDGSEPDDFWFNPLNWDTGVVPNGATDEAVVGAPSPTVTNGLVLLQSLTVTADGILNVGVSQNFNFTSPPGRIVTTKRGCHQEKLLPMIRNQPTYPYF